MTFRLVLWAAGVLLTLASRTSPRLRAQLARDMTVCIGSRDGVARSYVFRNRKYLARNSRCDGRGGIRCRGIRSLFYAGEAHVCRWLPIRQLRSCAASHRHEQR